MRHATAEEAAGGTDAARCLSDQGRREAKEAAIAIREREARPVIVLTSPRLRARETAEIVASALGVPVEVREGLNCGATAAAYLEALRPDLGREVLLVAHNPELSAFASALARTGIAFRPSTVCCFEISEESATLEWVRHPDQRSPS
jgi:phosphohistidine phosphatase